MRDDGRRPATLRGPRFRPRTPRAPHSQPGRHQAAARHPLQRLDPGQPFARDGDRGLGDGAGRVGTRPAAVLDAQAARFRPPLPWSRTVPPSDTTPRPRWTTPSPTGRPSSRRRWSWTARSRSRWRASRTATSRSPARACPRCLAEEEYHHQFGAAWFARLAGAGGEGARRLEGAARRRSPPRLRGCSPRIPTTRRSWPRGGFGRSRRSGSGSRTAWGRRWRWRAFALARSSPPARGGIRSGGAALVPRRRGGRAGARGSQPRPFRGVAPAMPTRRPKPPPHRAATPPPNPRPHPALLRQRPHGADVALRQSRIAHDLVVQGVPQPLRVSALAGKTRKLNMAAPRVSLTFQLASVSLLRQSHRNPTHDVQYATTSCREQPARGRDHGRLRLLRGSIALPEPRRLVIYSGARLEPTQERMEEVDNWVREQWDSITWDPSFFIDGIRQDSPAYPGRPSKSAGTNGRTRPESPLTGWGSGEPIISTPTCTSWRPSTGSTAGSRRPWARTNSTSRAHPCPNRRRVAVPESHLRFPARRDPRRAAVCEREWLHAGIHPDRPPGRVVEARRAWRAENPDGNAAFVEWFRQTFERDPPVPREPLQPRWRARPRAAQAGPWSCQPTSTSCTPWPVAWMSTRPLRASRSVAQLSSKTANPFALTRTSVPFPGVATRSPPLSSLSVSASPLRKRSLRMRPPCG